MSRAELSIRLRLEEASGQWFADRKMTRSSSGGVFWDEPVKLEPEQALAAAEAVGRGNYVRAILRGWANDAAKLEEEVVEKMVLDARASATRVTEARDRTRRAREAAEALAAPEGEDP